MAQLRLKNGFSLVEMLVSISLFALVWISLVGSILVGKASEVKSKHRMQATYASQRQIEALRKRTFSAIANEVGATTIDTRGTDGTADDLMGTQTTTVTWPGDATSTGAFFKKIVVNIAWREPMPLGSLLMATETIGTCIADDPQVN